MSNEIIAQPKLVRTNDDMLNGVYEVVDETSDLYLIVTPYPQQEKGRPTFAILKSRARPYEEKMTWFPCDMAIQEREGKQVIAYFKNTVAVIADGYRVRVDDNGLWHWEKGELHCSR